MLFAAATPPRPLSGDGSPSTPRGSPRARVRFGALGLFGRSSPCLKPRWVRPHLRRSTCPDELQLQTGDGHSFLGGECRRQSQPAVRLLPRRVTAVHMKPPSHGYADALRRAAVDVPGDVRSLPGADPRCSAAFGRRRYRLRSRVRRHHRCRTDRQLSDRSLVSCSPGRRDQRLVASSHRTDRDEDRVRLDPGQAGPRCRAYRRHAGRTRR